MIPSMRFFALGVTLLLGTTGTAHAKWKYWQVGSNVSARAVTTFGTEVYALSASEYFAGQGYQLKYKKWNTSADWVDADGRATSITSSPHRQLFAVAEDHRVWLWQKTHWSYFPYTNCEDGSHLVIAQTLGRNNIAVGGDDQSTTLYVISGTTTRWWNGSCWLRMPELPSGTVLDIAVNQFETRAIWARSSENKIYRWSSVTSAWIPESVGTGLSLNSDAAAVTLDGRGIQRWDFVTNSWTPDPLWTHGQITQLGGYSKVPNGTTVAVKADGTVWILANKLD